MESFTVALVSRDPSERALLARTFERAPASWAIELYEEKPAGADVVIATGDPGADVIFDPAHPERALAETRTRLSARRAATIHLVTGATSGCGITSLALHLASAFARRAETCLVDLDTRWRGVAERFDLLDEETKTWADAGDDEDSLRLAALPVRGGFRVLLAPPSLARPPDSSGNPERAHDADDAENRLRAEHVDPQAIVRRAAQQFARVVVDVPASLAPAALSDASLPRGPSVLVAPATRGGARRAAMLLETDPGGRWALVLNRLGAGGQESAARLARRAGRSTALELPCTPALRDAEEEGRLLEGPWTRWSRRIHRLARALERA